MKPEILTDERTAELSDGAWRLFVSVFLLADDYGNLRANPGQIAGQAFWAKPDADVAGMLIELAEAKLIQLYAVRGQLYAAIKGWEKHQRVDKPGKPHCPGPSEADDSRDSRETLETDPDPDPDPDPDRDLRPTTIDPKARTASYVTKTHKQPTKPESTLTPEKAVTLSAGVLLTGNGFQGQETTNLDGFGAAVANAGICSAQLGQSERTRFARLFPVMTHELAHAVERAQHARAKNAGYVLSVIEGEREKAHGVQQGGPSPGPAPPRLTRKGEELRQAMSHTIPYETFEGIFEPGGKKADAKG